MKFETKKIGIYVHWFFLLLGMFEGIRELIKVSMKGDFIYGIWWLPFFTILYSFMGGCIRYGLTRKFSLFPWFD